jgi:hypothetical protein
MLRVAGIESTTPAFRAELAALADRLDVNPDYLAAVMSRESGFNPAATNPQSKATGLIQFMPRTAHALGTTVDKLRSMTALQQLRFVEAFYRPFTGGLKRPVDAYMATFMPGFVGKPDSTVLFESPSIGYVQNQGFDSQHKGTITIGDVGNAISATLAAAESKPSIDAGPSTSGPAGFFVLATVALALFRRGYR